MLTTYYGTAEIAEACGVTQQAVSNWLAPDQMPKPTFQAANGAGLVNRIARIRQVVEREGACGDGVAAELQSALLALFLFASAA